MTSRTSRTSRTDKRGRARALTGREIGGFRRRLLEEFRTHASEVEAVEAEALEPSGGARFQDVDESGEESALDSDLTFLAAEDELGYAVHEALERIVSGTFGTCEACGRTIPRARLEVVPHARHCVACARAASR